ncbi:MAG TPA: urate oxidase [Pyrinomonadaceae bacterium]|nr:urate oxidase [Pyrinomonadaceae bacterium]
MSVRILHDNYGKARVRLIKVDKRSARHELQSLTLNIALEGDFEAVHLEGDNSLCLPTDTMKNTVYALAGERDEIEPVETFGLRLARHFLDNGPQITRTVIDITEHAWDRMAFEGEPHDHSFVRGGREKRTAKISMTRDGTSVDSGVEDLVVLKSARSGFVGFIKDAYTTLPEVTDRILATSIRATWTYRDASLATDEVWHRVRRLILETFAGHDSLSVQHTLYAIGQAVLEEFEAVAEIAFSLPNIHCLPVDISRFGLEDKNCIFIPTDEPHGLIEARLGR